MKKVRELYQDVEGFDPSQMGCLLTPDLPHATPEGQIFEEARQKSAVFDDPAQIEALSSADSKEALKEIRNPGQQVFALIAPAISGQFEGVEGPGKIRTALKALGFIGMVECAAFADILTLKEALEFDQNIKNENDFHLSSCCCPMWISMIRKECPDLFAAMPASVSPMIAAGRVVKQLHPKALTVFIGPCMAKKKEAKETDIADAVDFVLTFQELKEIFDKADINVADMPADEKEHSSLAGRIYARAGGVSEAVAMTLEQLNPNREVPFKSLKADGALNCKNLIKDLKEHRIIANFYEGMGCVGGCVGGPRKIIDKEKGTEQVNAYGKHASYKTPLDNPYILEMLQQLGYETVIDFIEKSTFLTRDFNAADTRILQP